MVCPNCQSELSPSKLGGICLNCGQLVSGSKRKQSTKAVSRRPKLEPKITLAPIAVESQTKEVAAVAPTAIAASAKLKRTKVKINIRLLLTSLVAIGLVAAVAYRFYYRPARQKLDVLATKIASAQTASFEASLKFSGPAFLSGWATDLNTSGSYDRSRPGGSGTLSGQFAGKDYRGDVLVDRGQLFFRLTGSDLPVIRYKQSSFLYRVTEEWHQTKLDQALFSNYCETRPDSRYPSGLLWYRLAGKLRYRASPWINLWAKLEGRSVAHYQGAVDNHSLAEAVDTLNSELPESCGVQLVASDLKNLKISYDLWTSNDFDRVKVQIQDKQLGSNLEVTIDGYGYSQPVQIERPGQAVDLDQLRQGQEQLLARDQTRRADIDKLKDALDNYYRANSQRYPRSLATLAPRYIPAVPTDPKTRQAYSYSVDSARRSFSLGSAMEEPGADVYSAQGP